MNRPRLMKIEITIFSINLIEWLCSKQLFNMNEPWKDRTNSVSIRQEEVSKPRSTHNDEDPLCRIYWQVNITYLNTAISVSFI